MTIDRVFLCTFLKICDVSMSAMVNRRNVSKMPSFQSHFIGIVLNGISPCNLGKCLGRLLFQEEGCAVFEPGFQSPRMAFFHEYKRQSFKPKPYHGQSHELRGGEIIMPKSFSERKCIAASLLGQRAPQRIV